MYEDQLSLRREFDRLINDDSFSTSTEVLDIYSKCYFDLVINHNYDKVFSFANADAKIILQMMLSKIIHLKKALEGFDFSNESGKVASNKIVDPTIIASLTRNIYETVCMFYLIFRNPKSEAEKKLVYFLWVLSGLKYRQRFRSSVKSVQDEEKLNQENQQIKNIEDGIKNDELFKSLDYKNQGKILTKIKEKDYRIQLVGNNVVFLDWHEISKKFDSKNLFENMYTYFSLFSHPSHTSVVQFGQMFSINDEPFKKITLFNIRNCFFLLSIFLADYIWLFPNTIQTFENRNNIEQIILNFYNKMVRGEEYSINDAWKSLG